MRPDEREALVALYEGRWSELGRDVRTLGWNDAQSQQLRFEVLCDGLDLDGASVLDVGCGFGDLADWLDARWEGVRYTGIDLSPSLLAEARRSHPGRSFAQVDLLEEPLEGPFELVVCSGALSFKVQDHAAHTAAMLRRMWELASQGVAANFLTSHVNYERPHNAHHRPQDVFALALELTPWVGLRHDYPLWEFTVQLHRNPRTS